MSVPEKPETIFRFESFSAQSLQNLKAGNIYFSHPQVFNDSYDCRLPFQFGEMTNEDALRVKQNVVSDPAFSEEQKREISLMSAEAVAGIIAGAVQGTTAEARERFFTKGGVACFSARNDSLLMWGHYGGRFKGFCLEFRTSHDPFSRIGPVSYSDHIPKLNAADIYINGDAGDQLLRVYRTKAKDWEYEQEWRSIHASAGTPFGYGPGALKAVYFGPEMEDAALEIICVIVQSQHENVEFWKGQRSPDEFKVVFNRFVYETHLARLKLGDIRPGLWGNSPIS